MSTTLYDRILGIADQIPIDTYCALLAEQLRGELTEAQVAAAPTPAMTTPQLADHQAIVARFPAITVQELRETLMLCESELFYTTIETFKARIGIPT